jgi:hypothetical protein
MCGARQRVARVCCAPDQLALLSLVRAGRGTASTQCSPQAGGHVHDAVLSRATHRAADHGPRVRNRMFGFADVNIGEGAPLQPSPGDASRAGRRSGRSHFDATTPS